MEIEKLDTILSLMNEQEGYRIVTPEMAESFISPLEYRKYSAKLVRDRFAVLLDKDKGFLLLTPKGAKHIKCGGYGRHSELLTNEKKRKERILLVFSVAIIIVSICLMFMKIHLFFQNV
ncbi:MAG TPA: hypothetical protein VGO45_10390 [Bacteroidia bacterium]|jgi:hypothetical protein|nr:hypothetical protein [Bacteroidia bacterium]